MTPGGRTKLVDIPDPDEIDVSSLEFWAQPARQRDEAYAVLRRERPVSFHRPITFGLPTVMPYSYPGFWLLASHALIGTASRNSDVLCSGQGLILEDVGIPQELREHLGSFMAMDGARHATLRRLVGSAFGPRNLARIEAQIAGQAKRIVDQLLETGDGDFVENVSALLPRWTISEMIGIPEEDRDGVARAAETLLATSDPEFVSEGMTALSLLAEAAGALWEAATSLAQDRRSKPRDDLMTALVQAEVDGRRLSDGEIGAFFVLLSVAGNDTTRNTISHTMKALCDNPSQRQRLIEDVDGRMLVAVEEFLRWTSPVIHFRRTATEDVVLGGQWIESGQTVVLLYESANRDEAVFEEPWRFDIGRHPNEHLCFGGGGPHYCMGARLARTQLRCIFTEILTRVPGLEVGSPEYLTSCFIHGIKRLPYRL